MPSQTCFVIMPIGQAGSESHAHFETIYKYIKTAVTAKDFEVVRADEVARAGAISKDIITKLAKADLVVADLTDLNPNVFYELGVRHALRGSGTVMVLDSVRTDQIPFDLSAYRVVKFKSDLSGIEGLTSGLSAYIDQSRSGVSERDNPVHDWFPTLPLNLIDANSGTEAGELRKRVKELERTVAQYEQSYGEVSTSVQSDSPLSVINSALRDAKDGLLPATVMSQIREALEQRNVVEFLDRITVAFDRGIRLQPTMYLELSHWAGILDLESVQRAILDQSVKVYPSEKTLQMAYLGHLAQSNDVGDRHLARAEIPKMLSFSLDEDTQPAESSKKAVTDLDINLIAILLDAYMEDNLHDDALKITTNLLNRFPEDSRVLRNHARALESLGKDEDAFEFFKQAVAVPSVDDTSAVWLGNEYQGRGMWRDAAEAYALACTLDPNDATNFARLALGLSYGFAESEDGAKQREGVPSPANHGTMAMLFSCALSCPNMGVEAQSRFHMAFGKADMDIPESIVEVTRADRLSCARGLLKELRT